MMIKIFVVFFLLVMIVTSKTLEEMKKEKFIPEENFINLVSSSVDFYKIINENPKVIVLFSSSDKRCETCEKYNKIFDTITKPLQKKYKVITVVCSKSTLSPICGSNGISKVPQIAMFKYAQMDEIKPEKIITTKVRKKKIFFQHFYSPKRHFKNH